MKSSNRKNFIIYNGRGTLTSAFSGPFLNLKELLEDSWDETYSTFIMPGGRDRPYDRDLRGAGNAKIRKFVENGGTYFGICAGAYYGCSQVEFNKGFPLEVCEERELSFFDGKGVGPAYGKGTFEYTQFCGARASKIRTEKGDFFVYYNGGCAFEGNFSDCKVLARYADLPDLPPAIIECRVGKGRVILSGVHIETSPSTLKKADQYLKSLIPLLEKDEERRLAFWEELINPSGLKLCLQSNENEDEK